MAPVTGSLILLFLFCAGALADDHGKPPPPPPRPPPPKPPPEKSGKCPPGPMAKCPVPLPPGECKVDKDCTGKQKCCMEMCTPTCKNPVPDMKHGTCPTPRTKCRGPLKGGDCNVDSDCTGIKKCCENDCKMECMNPRDKKLADQSWSCPAFNTLLPCESHPTHCTDDKQCTGNQKCCDYDCKWQCLPPQ